MTLEFGLVPGARRVTLVTDLTQLRSAAGAASAVRLRLEGQSGPHDLHVHVHCVEVNTENTAVKVYGRLQTSIPI